MSAFGLKILMVITVSMSTISIKLPYNLPNADELFLVNLTKIIVTISKRQNIGATYFPATTLILMYQ